MNQQCNNIFDCFFLTLVYIRHYKQISTVSILLTTMISIFWLNDLMTNNKITLLSIILQFDNESTKTRESYCQLYNLSWNVLRCQLKIPDNDLWVIIHNELLFVYDFFAYVCKNATKSSCLTLFSSKTV